MRWATYDSDGQQVLTCGDDGIGRVWDASGPANRSRPLLKHAREVEGGSFSPNGEYVITASRDRTAKIWKLPSGEQAATPLVHFAGVQNASFTPDGRQVVTGSRDGTARLWNVGDGSPATPPLSIGTGLVRAKISPCGRFVATAGSSRVMLWDMQSGQLLGLPFQHGDWTNEVGFSPDSKTIFTASEDGIGSRLEHSPCRRTVRRIDSAASRTHFWTSRRSDQWPGSADFRRATRVDQVRRK